MVLIGLYLYTKVYEMYAFIETGGGQSWRDVSIPNYCLQSPHRRFSHLGEIGLVTVMDEQSENNVQFVIPNLNPTQLDCLDH